MIFAIVFAQLWGVIQLFVLATLSRTVRMRTVIAAMAVGLYAMAPVAVILQKSWIGVAASLVGKSMADMTGIASYTVDPFIEEALKLLPLALLMLIPAIRRQWTLTDCLLVGAAIGSGFGLAEHLYRYASSPDAAEAVRGGWIMTFGRYTPTVPGIPSSLTSWLPNGVWFPEDPTRVNWHLAWSAIGGLALGIWVRNPKRAARLTAVGMFVLIGLDHAAGNTHDIANSWLAFLAWPLDLITSHLGLLAFVAVVAAWWLDRRAQPADDALEPLLAAERSASPRIVGTFTAAVKRLPWSIPWVFGFDRARRAYHAAHASAPDSVSGMLEALIAQRDRIEQQLVQPQAPPLIPPAWTPYALRNTLRQRPMIISLVLLAPSLLYLIIGGFPQTAWVQKVVTSGVVWPLVILITLAAQLRLVLRVARGARNLGKTSRLPIGDDAAILGLQLACGIGSVALGGFTLMRVFSGVSVGSTLLSHAHASDAANRLTPGSGVSVSNSGGAFDSHPGSNSNSNSNSDSHSNSNSDSNPGSQPSAPGSGDPDSYSPLPPPAPPPPGDPSDFQPAPPNANAESPSDYSPLPDPVIPVHDLPDAPPDPVTNVHDLPDAPPDPTINVHDLPDAPPTEAPGEGVGTRVPDSEGPTIQPVKPEANPDAGSQGTPDNEDGYGTREPDDDGYGTRHPDSSSAPSHPQPSAQDQADRAASDAADAAAKADADAQAAKQRLVDAHNAQDSSEIHQAATDPGADPDVAAARQRTHDAEVNSEAADNKSMLDGDDPWNPNARPDSQAAHDDVKAAQDAQAQAEKNYADQQQAAADAAKAASDQAQSALDAANAKAAAAHDASSQAASNAGHAANVDSAASDYAAAKAKADAAWSSGTTEQYSEAQKAALAAKQRLDDAQAAADAARDKSDGVATWVHHKP